MDIPTRALSPQEAIDRLRLIRTENVGPVTFRMLLARFGSAAAALDALPDLSRKGGRTKPIKPAPKAQVERELAGLTRLGGRFVHLGQPEYPRALAAIEDAPPVLGVRGHVHLLQRPSVAIVGARNASTNGRGFARRLAAEVAQSGYVIVSGLARGIDAAAHEGSLPHGTVACMAGGLDVVYPPENEALYGQVVEMGAAVSEVPLGVQPNAAAFPRRNRLVAGLSLGVVVIEAAPRSGSLITARLAGEQGREVMAVPGSPLDQRAQGCNGLLKQGATLVDHPDDVIQALSRMTRQPVREPQVDLYVATATAGPPPSDEVEAARPSLLEGLAYDPTPVDELVRHSHFAAPVVMTVLMELELAGRLQRHPGNKVSLVGGTD